MSRSPFSIAPARASHLFKGVVYLGLGIIVLSPIVVIPGHTTGNGPGMPVALLAGLGVPGVLLLLAASRNIVAMFRPPRLVIGPEGIEAQTWGSVFFTGIFLPAYRTSLRRISWSEFLGVETFTYRVNYVPVVSELRLKSAKGVLTIGSDHFAPGPKKIQGAVLDYLHEQAVAPLRTASRLSDFQRLRWKNPFVYPVPRNSPVVAFTLITVGAAVLLYAILASGGSFDPGDWPVFAGTVLLVFGGVFAWIWWEHAGCAFIELSDEGVRLGRSRRRSRLIGWDRILLARAHTENRAAATRFELRIADGTSTTVRIANPASLRQLMDLVEPDSLRVEVARQLMEQGESAERAAAAAGLATRPSVQFSISISSDKARRS